jgi:hypothetical protein
MQRQLYQSSNGDRWYLVRDSATGQARVRHVPNAPSGGRTSDIEIAAFLARPSRSPEQQALLDLIATLVDDTSAGEIEAGDNHAA